MNLNHTSNSSETVHAEPARSRYGWTIRPTTRMIESRKQTRTRKNQNIALCSNIEECNESLHVEHFVIVNNMDNPMALVNQVSDTMHLHHAIKQPDQVKFLRAMEEEVTTHERRGHLKIIPISAEPKREKILDSVWAMRRKRCIGAGEVRKVKTRLNAYGGQHVHCVNYWETFAPVVKCTTIRLIMILILTHEWKSRQMSEEIYT